MKRGVVMENTDALIPAIENDVLLNEDDAEVKMIMYENKMDKYLERLDQQEKENLLAESLFEKFFESSFQNGVSKEELINIIDNYDIYTVYHLLFELFGDDMSKDEYIKLKNRYIKNFDLEFVPLPECCEKLARKWGIKNV